MLIELKNVSYGWPHQPALFENINFSIQSGEIVAVLGPNGVGKTTLLKSIMGFIPLKKGEVFLNGQHHPSSHHKLFWSTVAYVPQAKMQRFGISCFDMVSFGRNIHMNTFASLSTKDTEKVHEAFKLLDIDYLKSRRVNEISGGEFQMVLIARALVSDPKLIILDEPESNLDFKNQLKILDVLTFLAKEKNIACLFNTHYIENALRISDKALLLGKNECLFDVSKKVITEKNIEQLFDVKVSIQESKIKDKTYYSVTPLFIQQGNKV